MTVPPEAGDTIAAVSTPPGRGGIGVIRVSGDAAVAVVDGCFDSREPVRDRLARYGVFRGPDKEPLDDVVVTVFRAPRSYTGEDVAEISAHGNPVVLHRILDTLVGAGARRAEPGEFTLRAVAHGKLDLAQAEAVRDFIAARTESQARLAMGQKAGALAKRIHPEKDAIVALVAGLEAGIDFAEDDVPLPDAAVLAERVASTASNLGLLADTFAYGRLIVEGLSVAITGKPNTGKSSLFNRLTVDGRAIVTDVPGTTRDVVTETATLGGVPLRFSDTAGIRTTADRVEAIGVDRTLEVLSEADLMLVVLDVSRPIDGDDENLLSRTAGRPRLVVANKRDLPRRWDPSRFPGSVAVSALTGEGVEALKAAIAHAVTQRRTPSAEEFAITSRRQSETLASAIERLGAAAEGLASDVPHEMILLDLYAALSSLGELTGEVTTDDILDRVFSTFCIGK